MKIEEMKQKFIDGTLDAGLYTAGDKVVNIFSNGFSISTYQDNGWIRINTYEYIDKIWYESETYEK